MMFRATLLLIILLGFVAITSADYLRVKYYKEAGCKNIYSLSYATPSEMGPYTTCASLLTANGVPPNTCVPANASNAAFNTFGMVDCVENFVLPGDATAVFGTNLSWFGASNSRENTCTNNIGAILYLADGSCVLKPDYGSFNLVESYKYYLNADNSGSFYNYTGTRDCSTANPIVQTLPSGLLNGKACLSINGLYTAGWYNKGALWKDPNASSNPDPSQNGSTTTKAATTPTPTTSKPSVASKLSASYVLFLLTALFHFF